MKITFHGAAQCVTGSKHLLTLKDNRRILLDCGMFQGNGEEADKLNRIWGFEPADVDVLVLSHAHIDHSGLIPKLIKDGFKGKIFCTPATFDLATVLLYDSAFIQESDIRFLNKKRAEQNLLPLKPIYTGDDVKNCLQHFNTVAYEKWFEILEGVKVQFTDAGHIVGSAAVHLDIFENGKIKKITFTGDIGRYNNAILNSPKPFRQTEIIICESTYGDKLHDDKEISAQQLLDAVNETCLKKKGKLIIPAFSVGRTQEILFAFNQLELNGKLPSLNYYVDSPLSAEATMILKRHKECFNSHFQKIMLSDKDPFDFSGLEFIIDKEDSQKLNNRDEPMVIISASGMADAGRVKHHIAHNISNPENTILIVGYCEPNSLGGRLMNGDKQVRIYGEHYAVKADVQVIRSFSAHGDYEDISQFLACQNPKEVEKFFVVHGEPKTQFNFQTRLLKKGFSEVIVPKLHQDFFV